MHTTVDEWLNIFAYFAVMRIVICIKYSGIEVMEKIYLFSCHLMVNNVIQNVAIQNLAHSDRLRPVESHCGARV
jgi:hypothetical protein